MASGLLETRRWMGAALLGGLLAATPVAVQFDPNATRASLALASAAAEDGGGGHSGSSGGSGSGGSGGGSDSGGSGSGGSDSGGSDSGGSGGSGRGGSDDGSSSGRSGRDDAGGHDDARRGDSAGSRIGPNGESVRIRGRRIEVTYPDGWRETLSGGLFQLWDPRGRRVIQRPATPGDTARLSAVAR